MIDFFRSKQTNIKHYAKRMLIIVGIALVIISIPFFLQRVLVPRFSYPSITNTEETNALISKISRDIAALDKKLDAKTPKSSYITINSASNEFSLYKNGLLIKKDMCSTGSYILLKDDKEQQWLFKTPRGEFRIQGKITSPVWRKPDWAFIEEGLPVPGATHESRYEYGVLGDYALSLGHGYLIHGTLYQRFLGLPVTHGCIRLNDENLELVYNTLQVGSKVYIY